MRRFLPFCLIIISTFLYIGCSTSLPLSEVYIFENNDGNNDTLSWKSSSSIAYSSNNNSGAIKRYLKKENNSLRDKDIWNLNKQGYGLILSKNFENFAVGANVGYPVFGINWTFDIGWNNYITTNLALAGGAEIILQRRIFYQNQGRLTGGLTMGIFGKRDYFGYDPGENSNSLIKTNYLNIIGIRSMLHLNDHHWRQSFHGFVSYGYSPELNDRILNVGFAFGEDFFK